MVSPQLKLTIQRTVNGPADLSIEFGNYVGGDLESDDDSDIDIAPATSAPGPSAPAQSYAPLEGLDDEDEAMDEDAGMEMTLHGVDGALRRGARYLRGYR